MGNCNKKAGSIDFVGELKGARKDRTESFAFVDSVIDTDGSKKFHIRPKDEAQAKNEVFTFEKQQEYASFFENNQDRM